MSTHTHKNTHTGATVKGQAAGGVEVFDEELRQDDLVGPQGVISILPVEHQVVLVVGVWRQRHNQGEW